MGDGSVIENALARDNESLSAPSGPGPETNGSGVTNAIVGERLTLAAFRQLSGNLAGYPFVKVVVDRAQEKIHFLNHHRFQFHADYIAATLLGISPGELDARLDELNKTFYHDLDRRFFLGVIALHTRDDRRFFSLETVEDDTMNEPMIRFFHRFVEKHLDPSVPLLFKPASHTQEAIVSAVPASELPRVLSHELFASAKYVPLNCGTAKGRLRIFTSDEQYHEKRSTLEWHDIIVMERVPDSIPRLAGIINAKHTTPLSHTNVLASGWQIPNAIQIGAIERIRAAGLEEKWVRYTVAADGTEIGLEPIDRPADADKRPSWTVHKVRLEEPDTQHARILPLNQLRMIDRYKYGTKAANLGELQHVVERGSEKLLGFYRMPRPPRPNLLPHLAKHLGCPENAGLSRAASQFLRGFVQIPRGIAIPFSFQQQFLQSSPKIQQLIGKLKMALELNAPVVDAVAVSLHQAVLDARIPDDIQYAIDSAILEHLAGVSTFVVRSSSNAEDLGNFSAAGIYESVNRNSTADSIFDAIKQVWASLLSPRSVRLRQEVGISLEAVYMGVVIQEEVPSTMGGVMVTTNPLDKSNFRDVYLNISPKVTDVVQGGGLPYQCLYNVVEGGGRTVTMGDMKVDLDEKQKSLLQKLALAGKLLQSHFSPDYTFSTPMDIEWLANEKGAHVLQIRPYAK